MEQDTNPNWMEDKLNEFYNRAIDHAISFVNSAIIYPVDGIKGKFINKDNLINSLTNLKKDTNGTDKNKQK